MMYFWMQEPKAEHDQELVAHFNDSMNAFSMEDRIMQEGDDDGDSEAADADVGGLFAGDPNLQAILAGLGQVQVPGQPPHAAAAAAAAAAPQPGRIDASMLAGALGNALQGAHAQSAHTRTSYRSRARRSRSRALDMSLRRVTFLRLFNSLQSHPCHATDTEFHTPPSPVLENVAEKGGVA